MNQDHSDAHGPVVTGPMEEYPVGLLEAAETIRNLYRTPNTEFSSQEALEEAWRQAILRFDEALAQEHDPVVLERCILQDPNWEVSVAERLKLLERARSSGVSSLAFLTDYFGYRAAHLDPGPEKEAAAKELKGLLEQQLRQ